MKDSCVCLICEATVATAKRHNVERYSQMCYTSYHAKYLMGRWFTIQYYEFVDSSSTAQLMVFIQMVFDGFSTKEELLTLLPLKTTMRGVDIYNTVTEFFPEKKVQLEKSMMTST